MNGRKGQFANKIRIDPGWMGPKNWENFQSRRVRIQ